MPINSPEMCRNVWLIKKLEQVNIVSDRVLMIPKSCALFHIIKSYTNKCYKRSNSKNLTALDHCCSRQGKLGHFRVTNKVVFFVRVFEFALHVLHVL